jgi:hypothetical protein
MASALIAAFHEIRVPIQTAMVGDGSPEDAFIGWINQGFKIFCLDSRKDLYEARMRVPLPSGCALPLTF